MNKKIILPTLACGLLISLAGCSAPQEEQTVEPNIVTETKIEPVTSSRVPFNELIKPLASIELPEITSVEPTKAENNKASNNCTTKNKTEKIVVKEKADVDSTESKKEEKAIAEPKEEQKPIEEEHDRWANNKADPECDLPGCWYEKDHDGDHYSEMEDWLWVEVIEDHGIVPPVKEEPVEEEVEENEF